MSLPAKTKDLKRIISWG